VEDAVPQCSWFLKPLQIVRLEGSIDITPEGVTIGRADNNDVVIPESGFPYVSAHHARVILIDQAPQVEDLGSTNGTLVNGVPVPADGRPIVNGDIIQLGNMGPRFAVVCAGDLGDTVPTMSVPLPETELARPDLSQSSLMRIKRALGIPRDSDLGAMIEHRGRRAVRLVWAGLALVVVAAAVVFYVQNQQNAAEAERLRRLNEQMIAESAETRRQLAAQASAWQGQKASLESERATLAKRLHNIEAGAGSSKAEMAALRGQLASTNEKLEAYNPVNLEHARLAEVRRVAQAVVYIETKVFLRHGPTGRLLHAAPTAGGDLDLNLDDNGSPYAMESSGSGFCVTEHGWILTNAHVVDPQASVGHRAMPSGFEAEVALAVIFSGSSQRHPATLQKAVREGDNDVALIKIEPFADMPYLPDIDLTLPVPELYSEVYLSGFPLGTMALQAGDVVIASTFKGILSRVVGSFLQVDAAVHPGNSGGPVMDNQGRILGVVTRVQRIPDGPIAPDIGYIIPVAALAAVWPPPKN